MSVRHKWLLAIVLAYAAAFRLAMLNRPFEYDAEGSGSLNGVLARSYLRFDWSQSRGMPILSLGPERAPAVVFYPDHPPLVPLLIAPFYRAFGVGEWQTRLPIALTTIGAILLLYLLVARVGPPRTAIVAAAVFAAAPMTLYFGGFADVVGMPLICLALLGVVQYVRFQRDPRAATFLPLAAAFSAAALCDWPAYVLAPVLAAHFVATRPRRDWRWAFALAAVASALFVATYAYITLATRSPWTWMGDLFARRSALVGGRSYTWGQWLASAARVNAQYHTWPLVVAGLAWTVLFAFRRRASAAAGVARLLIAWAAIYAVIGSKALFDHEWGWLAFTPGLAVAAALLAERLPARATAYVVVAFATWTTHGALAMLNKSRDRPFTAVQTARAIRLAAPDPRDVALVIGNDADAQLWFYADRPLRSGIWSIDDFERRVNDVTVDLMYNFDDQPWKGRASGVVFPRIWASRFVELHDYLDRSFPRIQLPAALAASFDVYDLRRSPAALASPEAESRR